MAVPNLPFWCSSGNREFLERGDGWMSSTANVALKRGTMWCSELAGRSNSLPVSAADFDVSASAPGARYGGYGPPGQPGATATGHRLACNPAVRTFHSDNHGPVKYAFSRDIALFGPGVGEKHLLNAGLNVAEAIGTTRKPMFFIDAWVDHDAELGIFSFNKDRPWNGGMGWLLKTTQGAGGRQRWIDHFRYFKAPPANTIWVPYIKTKQGEHDINIRVSSYVGG